MTIAKPAWIFAGTFLAAAGLLWVAGVTFGLFVAGAVGVLLVAPWLIATEDRSTRQLLVAACLTDGLSLVWLVAAIRDDQLTFWNWLGAYAVLLAVVFLQFALFRAGRGLGRSTAAAIAVLVMLLWLAAPFWLLHHLPVNALQRVADIHPLFAINSAIPLAVWTEAPLAYRLTNLNQDVFYSMPATVWPCLLAHLLVAGLVWISIVLSQRRSVAIDLG